MEDSSWIDALLSPDGERLLAELGRQRVTAENEIALITRLRRSYAADLVSVAMEQTRLRERAVAKFTHADRMLFTSAGLEQASSERMAAHHAARFASFGRVADLCSGIGGDAIGLAHGSAVFAVDRDPIHARLVRINADVNGVGGAVVAVVADVRELDLTGIPAAFIDPARRSRGKRHGPGQSEPSLDWCFALAERGLATGIKSSPALPTGLVPVDWELEFVSEERELKESAIWAPSLASARRRATLLPSQATMIERAGASVCVRAPGAFLLDPDPAVTRAGLVETLAEEVGDCWKIDDQVAFLSADRAVSTPFARTLSVGASMPFSLSRLRDELRVLNVGTVDIRKRGSAVDVDDLQKRLKLSGDRSATVVLTRVSDRPWAMICFDVP